MIKSHLLCWLLQWHSIEVTSWHLFPLHHGRLGCSVFWSYHTWFGSLALTWFLGFGLGPCLWFQSLILVCNFVPRLFPEVR